MGLLPDSLMKAVEDGVAYVLGKRAGGSTPAESMDGVIGFSEWSRLLHLS